MLTGAWISQNSLCYNQPRSPLRYWVHADTDAMDDDFRKWVILSLVWWNYCTLISCFLWHTPLTCYCVFNVCSLAKNTQSVCNNSFSPYGWNLTLHWHKSSLTTPTINQLIRKSLNEIINKIKLNSLKRSNGKITSNANCSHSFSTQHIFTVTYTLQTHANSLINSPSVLIEILCQTIYQLMRKSLRKLHVGKSPPGWIYWILQFNSNILNKSKNCWHDSMKLDTFSSCSLYISLTEGILCKT